MYINVKDIGGKDRGLKFNQLSLEEYTRHINVTNINSSTIYATFFAGLMGCCYVKNEEPDFDFMDVTDWVDKMYEDGRTEEIKRVCDTWAETFAYKDWLDKIQKAVKDLQPETKDKKKMSTGLKSTSSPLAV